MNNVRVISPYADLGGLRPWRGMWHSHLAVSSPRPEEAVAICRAGGYHFLGVTDHDNRYPLLPWSAADWAAAAGDRFLVIGGFEATHPLGHITCLGLDPAGAGIDAAAARSNRDEKAGLEAGYAGFLERAAAAGAFLALNHPHKWRGHGQRLLKETGVGRLHAMEIYNGNQVGKALAQGYTIDLLDECLSAGGRFWAAANPDCHSWDQQRPDGPFNGYSVVFAAGLSRRSIIDALKAGRFYASTGLEIESIRVDGEHLAVRAGDSRQISFYGAGGRLLRRVAGSRAAYRFRGDEGYVRVELAGAPVPDENALPRMAWLQPVLLQAGARTPVGA